MMNSQTIDRQETNPLTDFLRDSQAHIARLKKTRTPEILTVDGKAEIVVIDAVGYQEMLDRLEQLEDELELARFVEAINEGERDVAEGRVMPVDELFAEIGAKHGF